MTSELGPMVSVVALRILPGARAEIEDTSGGERGGTVAAVEYPLVGKRTVDSARFRQSICNLHNL